MKVPVSYWSFLLHQLSWLNGLCGLDQICVTIWAKSAQREESTVISCHRILLDNKWVFGTVWKWKTIKLVLKWKNSLCEMTHLSIILHVLYWNQIGQLLIMKKTSIHPHKEASRVQATPCLQDPHQVPWQPALWEKQDAPIPKCTEVRHQDLGSCTSYWYHTMGI